MKDSKRLRTPDATDRARPGAGRAMGRAGEGRRALCGRGAASAGRADRPRRPRRSDRAAVRSGRCANCRRHADENADPIGDDAHSPVEGIVHRYPDRVLLKLVHVCAVYCRFCFRREMVGPGKPTTLSKTALDDALDYIRAHKEIWEVILTGGDPLVLSPRRLRDGDEGAGRDRPCQGHPHPYPRCRSPIRNAFRRSLCGR